MPLDHLRNSSWKADYNTKQLNYTLLQCAETNTSSCWEVYTPSQRFNDVATMYKHNNRQFMWRGKAVFRQSHNINDSH